MKFSTMLKLKIFLILILINFNCCDWVKISTNPDSNEFHPSSTSISLRNSDESTFSKYEETHSILNKFLEEEPPSKEWLLYQKERFQNIDNSQKFSVVEDQLKTSFQIAVPITITAEKHHDLNETNSTPFSDSKNSQIHPNRYKNKIIDDKLLLQANNSMEFVKDKIFLKRISMNEDFVNKTNKFEEILIENENSINNSDKHISSKSKTQPNKKNTPKSAPKSKFQEFLNFMKSLQNNLITKTARNIKNKIEKLKELRDKLLINIEDRVLALWPQPLVTKPPPIKQSKREKRGLFEESHSNFPSSETALITICFLTFAVFLIKLVLQVINTLKSKHYNINGLALNAMEPMTVARNKRNAHHFSAENDYENYLQIISNIVTSTESLKT